jgi:hypothetical protein
MCKSGVCNLFAQYIDETDDANSWMRGTAAIIEENKH